MRLKFRGGSELFYFKINRKKKLLHVSSSKTFYRYTKQPWKMLFDTGKEEFQEKIADQLSDEQFRLAIIEAMKGKGYILQDGSGSK